MKVNGLSGKKPESPEFFGRGKIVRRTGGEAGSAGVAGSGRTACCGHEGRVVVGRNAGRKGKLGWKKETRRGLIPKMERRSIPILHRRDKQAVTSLNRARGEARFPQNGIDADVTV